MNSSLRSFRLVPLLLAVAWAASCASRDSQEPPGTQEAAASPPRAYADADARFMRDMIHHHAQAIEMTDLVASHTENEDIQRLSRRIDVSQKDEIAQMKRWLEMRGETLPEEHVHGPLMPGMLTEEEMGRLAAARGPEFDRLFLESMIRHHEGALEMVAGLLSTEGAAREPTIFQFVSHVDADQRAEIARMQSLLSTLQGGNE